MEVAAMVLADGLGITLVNRGDGWRFSQWWRGSEFLLRPGEKHTARAFETPEVAVKYFSECYEEMASRRSTAPLKARPPLL